MSEWLRGDDKAIVNKEAGGIRGARRIRRLGLHGGRRSVPVQPARHHRRRRHRRTGTAEVADTYFALMDRLGTDGLLTAVSELPRDDRWHSLARLAIRDDIYASLRSLCFDVLAVGEPDESGEAEDRRMGAHQRVAGGAGTSHADRDLRERR